MNESLTNEFYLYICQSGMCRHVHPVYLHRPSSILFFPNIVKKVKVRKINRNLYHIFVRVNILQYIINNNIKNQISNCIHF